MSTKIKILAFAGATRKDSLNKKLIKLAAAGAEKAGAEVTLIDLKDYPMPLYDGDLESASGLPEKALELKKLMAESDGFLISSPEYNSSFSAVLKNSIDWTSRPQDKSDVGLSAYRGKYAGIMAVSPGPLGGLRGLYPLRELLQNIAVTVLPAMQAIGSGMTAFNDDGSLQDEKKAAAIADIGKQLVDTLTKLKAAA